MMDFSVVHPNHTEADARETAALAVEHRANACFSLQTFTGLLVELLADEPDIHVGAVVGFPAGGVLTEIKAAEARALRQIGADELDMVLNVGLMKSGRHDEARDDMQAVVDAAEGVPVKVIMECHYLDADELRRACQLAVEAGAAFVKTGTGYTDPVATPDRIRIMKDSVGDRCQIKAAGGVRSLETLVELYRCGATRFGVSTSSAVAILTECASLPDGCVDV